MADNKMDHEVFISYSSKDVTAAQAVCHILEENGIRCWMAPRDIPPGAEYGDLIDDAIKSAAIVVILFSRFAKESDWVKGEINVAFEEQKVIIPFRIDDTPLTGQTRVMLNQRHWIDAYPDYRSKFHDLLRAVSSSLGHDSQSDGPELKQSDIFRKLFNKTTAWILAAVAIVALAAVILFNRPTRYNYSSKGLKVENKSLSKEAGDALTSILDGMVRVEGGTFMMGNDYSEPDYLTVQDSLSTNPHKVTISSYYISDHEVTRAEWNAIMSPGDNASESAQAIDKITWEEAKAFADTLSTLSGLSFALPTEAQWEYAARGGNQSRGNLFAGHSYDVRLIGWTVSDGISSASDVRLRSPNELGLYDMTGNVSEWCADYYGPYMAEEANNPTGPADGSRRIVRGGDYRTPEIMDLKTTTRYASAPFVPREGTGMRLVVNI